MTAQLQPLVVPAGTGTFFNLGAYPARIILSRALLRQGGAALIGAGALGVAGSMAFLLQSRSVAMAGVAIVLLGFSIAAIFPTTLGVAGARYPSHSGTVFGILIGLALAGGMTLPWVAGRIAEGRGIRAIDRGKRKR